MVQLSPQLPINFREADLEAVFQHIHAGKSVEIIGLGSVGKSNFIRRLIRRDVQERYLYQLYQEKSHCIFISLDANSLLEPMPSAMDSSKPSSWAGYELIASRLLRAVMAHKLVTHITNPSDPAHPEALYAMYHRIWPGDNIQTNAPIIAFRYLEDLIERIFVGFGQPLRLVFVLDELEKYFQELPDRFFQGLRSLRDQYKDRILFVTTARQIMPLLLPDEVFPQYEPFAELFSNSRHFLLPYRPADAEQTFKRMSARQDYPPPPIAMREQLMAVTGGHAGLLQAAFAAWAPNQLLTDDLSDSEAVAILLGIDAVQDECKTMWRSLSVGERKLLFQMVQGQHQGKRPNIKAMHNSVARLLIQKGILLETESMAFENIRPLVFAAFLLSTISDDVTDFAAVPTFTPPSPF
jgi:hypothetical protein